MNATSSEAPFLRPREAAALLSLSVGRVYQLLRAGELPGTRVGGALRIPVPAFQAWLQKKSDDALAGVARG